MTCLHSLRIKLMSLVAFAICIPGVTSFVQASPIVRTFTIDPSKSNYTVKGSVADSAGNSHSLLEQSAGSMQSSLSGYLTVEYTPGGQLTVLSADLRSPDNGTFQPLGSPASIAYQANTSDGIFFGAQRNIDVTMLGNATLAGDGSFNTDSFKYAFGSATIDYFFPGTGNRHVNIIPNVFAPPPAGLQGVLNEAAPGGPTLTFDIAGLGVITGLRNGGSLSLEYQGSVQAVAVPEASTFVLSFAAALFILANWLYVRYNAFVGTFNFNSPAR